MKNNPISALLTIMDPDFGLASRENIDPVLTSGSEILRINASVPGTNHEMDPDPDGKMIRIRRWL